MERLDAAPIDGRAPENIDGNREEPRKIAGIVGASRALAELLGAVCRVARADVPVHIFGETGTGKEKIAEALHRESHRSAAPFLAVNAAALSDELFEAEMYGHARGAFTGALTERYGYLREAEGGTLFIDEVTELTPRAQAKLLRLCQKWEYRRVGEAQLRRANLRLVTASNVRLEDAVERGGFRADLMFRLNAVVLVVPPLRERGDDVLRLARHFLKRECDGAAPGRPVLLCAEAMRMLHDYAWPGNVRELENEMRRATVLADDGIVRVEHLSPRVRNGTPHAPLSLREARAAFERDFIVNALAQNDDNRSRTASRLGLSRQALVAKISRLGLGRSR